MEHRNGSRKTSNMITALSQNGKKLGVYPVLNIGSGGLAIMGKVKNLATNSLVTIQLPFSLNGETTPYEARAFVVHQNLDMTGLMWVENTQLTAMESSWFAVKPDCDQIMSF